MDFEDLGIIIRRKAAILKVWAEDPQTSAHEELVTMNDVYKILNNAHFKWKIVRCEYLDALQIIAVEALTHKNANKSLEDLTP